MAPLDKILFAWKKNNSLTLFLHKNIEDDWQKEKLHKKGRTVKQQFLHMVQMRLMWSTKINNKIGVETKLNTSNKKTIVEQLSDSHKRIQETFIALHNQNEKGNFTFDTYTLFTRLIAHEAHHRSQIIAIIKVNDLPINNSVNYGLWTWGHNFN